MKEHIFSYPLSIFLIFTSIMLHAQGNLTTSDVKKNKYREFEITTADYQNVGFSYKIGVKKIYGLVTLGRNYKPEFTFPVGVGVGIVFKMNEKWLFRPELIGYYYVESDLQNYKYTNVLHLKGGFMRLLNRKIAVTFAPSFYAAFKEQVGFKYGFDISPIEPIASKTYINKRVDYGFGVQVGLSFVRYQP